MTDVLPSTTAISSETLVGVALRQPHVRKVLEAYMPELRDSATKMILSGRTLALVIATSPALEADRTLVDRLWNELGETTSPPEDPRPSEVYRQPSLDYEPHSIARSSAHVSFTPRVSQYQKFELVLDGPSHGNPFLDVELTAEIVGPSGVVHVPGFYDDLGVYRVRYLAEQAGEYRFLTRSNARSLDGIEGVFGVDLASLDDHGPVRVKRTFHFEHADGTRYLPVGTTAYAWTHQGDELEEQTLTALAASPFNKLRMCLFPKSYLYNDNEPPSFPFPQGLEGGFDFQRFDTAYWRHLEERIGQLDELQIQADLILFHPYDRWGFANMGAVVDDRYLNYVVARLAAFPNVWWSLANEYDLIPTKSTNDWERLASVIVQQDPTAHLRSIHNCFDFYDYSRPWVTHASIQRRDLYKTSEMTDEWRRQWGKPVVIDECGYEGDIDQGWGNLTGKEMVRRFWEGAIRGGYVGHGETYLRPDDVLWWSKGGSLHGESPGRVEFLRGILDDSPLETEPLAIDWDVPSAGIEGEYYLFYYGLNQPRFRRFLWDPAASYSVDVIDTWNMTIERLPGVRRGRFTIELPGRPYMALRFQATT